MILIVFLKITYIIKYHQYLQLKNNGIKKRPKYFVLNLLNENDIYLYDIYQNMFYLFDLYRYQYDVHLKNYSKIWFYR